MSDPRIEATRPPPATRDDKTMPVVVYVLYLLGPVNGLTVLIGLVMAYWLRSDAGPRAASHYEFQIRTAWIGLFWCAVAVGLFVAGLPLTLVLIGFLFLKLAGLVFLLVGVWFAVRSAFGLYKAVRDEPYPRPRSWMI